jgi:putative glutamine amidotransferase
MTGPPLIGITTSEVRLAERAQPVHQGEPQRSELTLGLKYPQAIERAGGIPVVIPLLEPAAYEPLLDRLAGLCLSGGPDLDPETYGESSRHPELGPVEAEVDRFELGLLRAADARRMPILAICRGLQTLNVARGGALHQHVPDLHGAIEHRQGGACEAVTHPARIAPDSLVARTIGRTDAEVNSFHHQAISRIGRGLRPVGWAPDGLVEALEADDRDFVVAVQWHAECLFERPEQEALFEAFVAAALGRAGDHAPPLAPVR